MISSCDLPSRRSDLTIFLTSATPFMPQCWPVASASVTCSGLMSLMINGPHKLVEIIDGENHVAVGNVSVGYLVKRQRHLKLQRPMLPDPILKPFVKSVTVLGIEQHRLARLLVGAKRSERFPRAPRVWHVGIERANSSHERRDFFVGVGNRLYL